MNVAATCPVDMRTERRWALAVAERERLVRLATSRLGPCADVEDCVQEAMIRAVTFEALDESRLGPLLTTITLRLCVDHQRRTARDRRLALRVGTQHTAAEGSADEANGICERHAAAWLFTQTAALGAREREVIMARANGMSTAEAARALRITHKSAESAFTRARGRLRSLYHAEMTR